MKHRNSRLFNFIICAVLNVIGILPGSALADSASKSVTCQSGKQCTMTLQSIYTGHIVSPDYDFDITASQDADLQIGDNTVTANIVYTLADSSFSSADGVSLNVDDVQHRFEPTKRPDSDQSVTKLNETILATFTNNSAENKTGSLSIKHNYGQNSDIFTYNITVTPPPPVCTTSLSASSIDLGTITTSRLRDLSPGESTGLSGSVRVSSQCSYTKGIAISLVTNQVAADGCLAGGGGVEFCPSIDGEKVTFTTARQISLPVSAATDAFDFGVTLQRSGEKPEAGSYKNIITITTTAS